MTRTRRDTKKWKAAQDRFRAAVAEWLRSLGAVESSKMYEWRIETVAGTLMIDPSPYDPTVFTRFDEPGRARAIGIDCNRYTGKWNFHADDHATAIEVFQRALTRILPSPTH